MLTCELVNEKDALIQNRVRNNPPAGVPAYLWMQGHKDNIGPEGAWYRGVLAGKIEAILALQEMGCIAAAEKLQKQFNIEDDGSIILFKGG